MNQILSERLPDVVDELKRVDGLSVPAVVTKYLLDRLVKSKTGDAGQTKKVTSWAGKSAGHHGRGGSMHCRSPTSFAI